MQNGIKVKLILLAFLMMPVAYMAGNENGMKLELDKIDQEAFDSYIHFSKPFQKQVHKVHAQKLDKQDVFAAAGF